MGRTSKAIIDAIRQLSGEGFGPKEISEKLKIDRATAAKYSADKPGTPGKGNGAESQIIFECFFELLQDLSSSAFLEREQLADMVDQRALEVAKKLFHVNKELARKVLAPQIRNLKSVNVLDLSVPDQDLRSSDLRRLRGEWVDLLKVEWPEMLGELL